MLGLYGKKDIKADPKFFGFRRYEKEKDCNARDNGCPSARGKEMPCPPLSSRCNKGECQRTCGNVRRTKGTPTSLRGHPNPRGLCALKTQYQETNEMKNFTFTAIWLVWLILGVILAFIGIVSPIVALLPILLPIGFIFAMMLITEWSTLFTMILQKRMEKKKED